MYQQADTNAALQIHAHGSMFPLPDTSQHVHGIFMCIHTGLYTQTRKTYILIYVDTHMHGRRQTCVHTFSHRHIHTHLHGAIICTDRHSDTPSDARPGNACLARSATGLSSPGFKILETYPAVLLLPLGKPLVSGSRVLLCSAGLGLKLEMVSPARVATSWPGPDSFPLASGFGTGRSS